MESKADNYTVTKDDPSDVFILNPRKTETLIMDRSSGELMNCSINDHNDEFQDNSNSSPHDSKDFHLQEDSNSDVSANKDIHSQVEVNNTD